MNSRLTNGASAPRPLRGRFLTYVLGTGMIALGLAGAVFALYALIAREPWSGFVVVALFSVAAGAGLRTLGSPEAEPSVREALAATMLTWAVLPAVSAIPYVLTGGLNVVDAVFEGMSGFSTTGATTITEFGSLGHSLIMWRSFAQWVGGLGIVVVFVAVFPRIAVAGRQFFYSEVPGPTEERLTPRLQNTATAVLLIYAILTVAAVGGFLLVGMPLFDAVIYSFGTVATGGFAPDAMGLKEFGPSAQWMAIPFMFLGGMSFPFIYRVVTGGRRTLSRNSEFRVYLGLELVAAALLTVVFLEGHGFGDSLRNGLFHAVSITTTTGYVADDFVSWSLPGQMIVFLMLFAGGSASSAAGGPTLARWIILFKHAAREVRKALHPRAVVPVRVGERSIPEEVVRAVTAFFILYVGLYVVGATALVFFGADLVTALTAAIACLGLTGPGLGPVGPLGSYDMLHPGSKVVLTLLMYAGRLEVVTLFVVFDPSFWRGALRSWPRLGHVRSRH